MKGRRDKNNSHLSRPLVGSSRKSRTGLVRSSCATQTRLRSPPEMPCTALGESKGKRKDAMRPRSDCDESRAILMRRRQRDAQNRRRACQ